MTTFAGALDAISGLGSSLAPAFSAPPSGVNDLGTTVNNVGTVGFDFGAVLRELNSGSEANGGRPTLLPSRVANTGGLSGVNSFGATVEAAGARAAFDVPNVALFAIAGIAAVFLIRRFA